MNLWFTTHDENEGGGYAGVARAGRHEGAGGRPGSRDDGVVLPRQWKSDTGPPAEAGGKGGAR